MMIVNLLIASGSLIVIEACVHFKQVQNVLNYSDYGVQHTIGMLYKYKMIKQINTQNGLIEFIEFMVGDESAFVTFNHN